MRKLIQLSSQGTPLTILNVRMVYEMIFNPVLMSVLQYCHACLGVAALYFINNPGAVEVSVLRWLPPAQACGWGSSSERDLQGHQVSCVTAVTVEELLQESPVQTSIHGELQEHRLGAWVRSRFTTAQSQEELDKPDQDTYTSPTFLMVWRTFPRWNIWWVCGIPSVRQVQI